MTLSFFRTAWGIEGSWVEAARQARDAGFAGLEAPLKPNRLREIQTIRGDLGMEWICEISTTGFAVPDPRATPREHLHALARAIEAALPLEPILFTTMAGNDLWDEATSLNFLREAVRIGHASGLPLAIETHRSRSLGHPRFARRAIEEIPDLELTCDFSHWCVVCERLVLEECPDLLELCARRVRHIHARVGWDQGAQVEDLQAPRHREAVTAHLGWWRVLLEGMAARGMVHATLTPEYGPDGYQPLHPDTGQPAGDLWQLAQQTRQLILQMRA